MKKDGRSVSIETLEQYRFRALELRDKRWKVNKIAEALAIAVGTGVVLRNYRRGRNPPYTPNQRAPAQSQGYANPGNTTVINIDNYYADNRQVHVYPRPLPPGRNPPRGLPPHTP